MKDNIMYNQIRMLVAITTLLALSTACGAMETELPIYEFNALWDRTLLKNCKNFTFTAKAIHKPIGTINQNNTINRT